MARCYTIQCSLPTHIRIRCTLNWTAGGRQAGREARKDGREGAKGGWGKEGARGGSEEAMMCGSGSGGREG